MGFMKTLHFTASFKYGKVSFAFGCKSVSVSVDICLIFLWTNFNTKSMNLYNACLLQKCKKILINKIQMSISKLNWSGYWNSPLGFILIKK